MPPREGCEWKPGRRSRCPVSSAASSAPPPPPAPAPAPWPGQLDPSGTELRSRLDPSLRSVWYWHVHSPSLPLSARVSGPTPLLEISPQGVASKPLSWDPGLAIFSRSSLLIQSRLRLPDRVKGASESSLPGRCARASEARSARSPFALPPRSGADFPTKPARESLESLSPRTFLSCWTNFREPGVKGRTDQIAHHFCCPCDPLYSLSLSPSVRPEASPHQYFGNHAAGSGFSTAALGFWKSQFAIVAACWSIPGCAFQSALAVSDGGYRVQLRCFPARASEARACGSFATSPLSPPSG